MGTAILEQFNLPYLDPRIIMKKFANVFVITLNLSQAG